MWNKMSTEFSRLVTLRRAVAEAFKGGPPLRSQIGIKIEVHAKRLQQGELDNFITGVCDGLMAAHKSTPICEEWLVDELQTLKPDLPLGIVDDSAVVSIEAQKHVGAETEWYSLQLEGE
jgi:hypothetical protein